MKILFCRYTHDKNGDLHWWLKGKEFKFKGLGVHALSKEGVTFDEYVYEHIKYQKDNPVDYNIPYEIPTYIELLEDLTKMIRLGICVVKEE